MMAIYYVHWNEVEAKAHAAELAGAGYRIQCHASAVETLRLEELPDVLVVSLDRLPSHGRAVAEWFRTAKQRRAIPLLFVGGAAEKVAATRARFPEAVFCGRGELPAALARLAS